MKAVPVLLCIALAHGVTASIFKQPGVDTRVPEYIQYDQQYSSRHRNQPTEIDYDHYYQNHRLYGHERDDDHHRDQTRNQQYVHRVEEYSRQRAEQPSHMREQPRMPNYGPNKDWQYGERSQYAEEDQRQRYGEWVEPSHKYANTVPEQSQKYAKPLPEQSQQYAKTLPEQSEQYAKTLPEQSQHYGKTLPEQSQQYSKPLPEQSQQYAKPLPEQSQQYAKIQPEQSQQYAKTLPEQSQQYAKIQPEQSQQYAKTLPEQSQQYAKTQPEQSQQYAKTQPEQSQQYGKTLPEQSQQYAKTVSEESQKYEKSYQQVKPESYSASNSQEQDREQYSSQKQSQYSYNKQRDYAFPGSSSTESSQEAHEGRQYNEKVKTYSLVDNIGKLTPGNLYGKHEKPSYGTIVDRVRTDVPNSIKEDIVNVFGKHEKPSLAYIVDKVRTDVTIPIKEDIEHIFGGAQKTMKYLTDEVRDKVHKTFELVKHQQNKAVLLNATQLAQQFDYRVEQHTVKTYDGYLLTIFRILPHTQIRDVQKRPVVFLMHGIDGSADDWLLMGPKNSLAFLLSDAGYDVWLGNARGNKYSNRHVSKHPALSDFWQYSIDEIALHDLPAMIDYALETTKQEKLFFIGHSQGATAFFALTSTKPEYNNKINMMYALSPMVYMTNVRSPLFRMISPANKIFNHLQDLIGYGAFRPSTDLIQYAGGSILEKLIGVNELSSNVYLVMAGANLDNVDPQVLAMVMRHLPSGTSSKVIKQYGQGVASQDFRKFDYGARINMQVYGSEQPPKYSMEKVKAPVTLYYSEEDWLAHPKDVERLQNELPNVKESYKVSDSHFGSMDFQFSNKAPEMVYRRLIESMQNQYRVY